jgi:hypothetical protein
MRNSIRHALIALLVTVVVAGSLYWTGGHASLAVVAGMCWGAGLAVTLRIGQLYPDFATGDAWTDRRWTGLSVGLVSLAALVGVSPYLPVSATLGLELGALVLGAGLASYAMGTMAVLERTVDDASSRPSGGATSSADDD